MSDQKSNTDNNTEVMRRLFPKDEATFWRETTNMLLSLNPDKREQALRRYDERTRSSLRALLHQRERTLDDVDYNKIQITDDDLPF